MEMITILTRAILRLATSSKIALVLSITTAASLYAGKLPGADEAVRQLLPDGSYERETLLLTKAEQSVCAESASQKAVGALVTRYVARSEAGIAGYAYLDKHQVRTLPQILMVAVDADGALVGIRVLAFREPAEYMARDGWMEQFRGKTVQDEIRMKKNIDGITGATLTSRAVTQCARRVMAIHQVLEQRDKE
jgi:Na+-translocating ferredoxin:NAD+ oxidoreductase RnfG subunit